MPHHLTSKHLDPYQWPYQHVEGKLQHVLASIISKDQGTFVHGRKIPDGC